MREKLKDYVDSLFQNAPDTARVRELREEILQNTLDRFDDLIAQGCSEDSAFGQAVASIGDVRQLWSQTAAPVPAKKSRTGWIIGGCVAAAAVIALLAGAAAQWLRPSPAHYQPSDRSDSSGKEAPSLGDGIGEVVDWAMDLGDNLIENVVDSAVNVGITNMTYDHPEQYTAGPAEVSAAEVQEIRVNWISGSVTVEAYEGDTISITETEQTDEEFQLHWRQDGKKLVIYPYSSGKHTNAPSKNLLIRVPADLAAGVKTLNIDTTSADAQVSGLTLDSLEFDTTSGSLTAQADCRELSVDTTSGGMEFAGTASEVEIDTTSGSFTLDFTETPDELSFDSVSGSIVLTLPGERGFEAEMETVSGSLNCDYETQTRKNTWTYAGTGGGRQAELEFDTVSGSVAIRRAG